MTAASSSEIEAVLLTPKRKMQPEDFEIESTSKYFKFLVVWLETNRSYTKQITRATTKAQNILDPISSHISKIGRLKSSQRKVLSILVKSQML